MSLFYRILRRMTNFLFQRLYKFEVIGIENIHCGAAIIASNHTSYFDPPILGCACPEVLHFVARKSLFRKKWVNSLFSSLNAYPIAGNNEDRKTLRMVSEMLQNEKKVVIFPEGERSWSGKVQQLKPGVGLLALKNQCPIIPVYIHGAHTVWKRAKRFPRLTGKITCVIGEPIYPDKFAHLDKRSALDCVTEEIEQSLCSLQKKFN